MAQIVLWIRLGYWDILLVLRINGLFLTPKKSGQISDSDRKHDRFPKKMVVCLVREMGPRLFFWESQISPRLVKHYSIQPDKYLEDHPI